MEQFADLNNTKLLTPFNGFRSNNGLIVPLASR